MKYILIVVFVNGLLRRISCRTPILYQLILSNSKICYCRNNKLIRKWLICDHQTISIVLSSMQQPNLDINFINFNQDCSSLAIGTKTGYKLFSLNSVDKLDLIYESACRDVTIVERLFSSSLLALVSQSSPRRLRVCHFKKGWSMTD